MGAPVVLEPVPSSIRSTYQVTLPATVPDSDSGTEPDSGSALPSTMAGSVTCTTVKVKVSTADCPALLVTVSTTV